MHDAPLTYWPVRTMFPVALLDSDICKCLMHVGCIKLDVLDVGNMRLHSANLQGRIHDEFDYYFL